MGTIAENLKSVRQRIEVAAMRIGRDPSSIKLVAVSKTKTADEIAEAIRAGQFCFGENYAQEMREKYEKLTTSHESRVTSHEIEWHFIGHLQKNKAKIVAPIASWIETIDSLELAEALNRRVASHPHPDPEKGRGPLGALRPLPSRERELCCLIEINVGGEETKAGIDPSEVQNIIRGFGNFKNLKLKGLMIIPPFSPDPEFGRPYFKQLKSLLLDSRFRGNDINEPLTELSMGMSHDFEVAIEEGATIIRVGTAIFGERK